MLRIKKLLLILQTQTQTNVKHQNFQTMTYTTTMINRDFRIKANGINNQGEHINILVGVSGLLELVGETLAEKFIGRAYESGQDATTCKLRRGLKITFYVK